MNTELARHTRNVPAADERLFLEMVNDVSAFVGNQLSASRAEGFFGRLLSGLTGRSRRRTDATLGALAQGHVATRAWLSDVVDRQTESDLALLRAATVIRDMQYELAHVRAIGEQALHEVRELADLVADMARIVDRRLADHESRLDEHTRRIDGHDRSLIVVQLWQRAWMASERSLFRWERRAAYRHLPWIYQVTLLAQETFGGPVGAHEYVTGALDFRERLVDHLLADPVAATGRPGKQSLADLLDQAVREVEPVDERQMLAELLGDGLDPRLGRPGGGLTAALRWTMTMAARPEHLRPRQVAVEAVDLGLAEGYFPTLLTVADFTRRMVTEQAEAALTIRTALLGDRTARAEEAEIGRAHV